jgi:hypothetical protein
MEHSAGLGFAVHGQEDMRVELNVPVGEDLSVQYGQQLDDERSRDVAVKGENFGVLDVLVDFGEPFTRPNANRPPPLRSPLQIPFPKLRVAWKTARLPLPVNVTPCKGRPLIRSKIVMSVATITGCPYELRYVGSYDKDRVACLYSKAVSPVLGMAGG